MEARTRHSGGANYLLADGHVKLFKEPSQNRQPDGFTPTESKGPVVWKQSSNPNAAAWFLEGF